MSRCRSEMRHRLPLAQQTARARVELERPEREDGARGHGRIVAMTARSTPNSQLMFNRQLPTDRSSQFAARASFRLTAEADLRIRRYEARTPQFGSWRKDQIGGWELILAQISSASRAAMTRSCASCGGPRKGGEVPHLAAGARAVLAVEMQLHVAAAASPPPSSARRPPRDRRGGWPSRPAARRSVDPSGRPQIARNCCSNWLVTAASNVR